MSASPTTLVLILPETDELTRPGTVITNYNNCGHITNFSYTTASEITDILETALIHVLNLPNFLPTITPTEPPKANNSASDQPAPVEETVSEIVQTTIHVTLPNSEDMVRPGTAMIRRGDFGFILNFTYSSVSDITATLEELILRVIDFEANAPQLAVPPQPETTNTSVVTDQADTDDEPDDTALDGVDNEEIIEQTLD